MSYYNMFGEYKSTNNIETMADTKSYEIGDAAFYFKYPDGYWQSCGGDNTNPSCVDALTNDPEPIKEDTREDKICNKLNGQLNKQISDLTSQNTTTVTQLNKQISDLTSQNNNTVASSLKYSCNNVKFTDKLGPDCASYVNSNASCIGATKDTVLQNVFTNCTNNSSGVGTVVSWTIPASVIDFTTSSALLFNIQDISNKTSDSLLKLSGIVSSQIGTSKVTVTWNKIEFINFTTSPAPRPITPNISTDPTVLAFLFGTPTSPPGMIIHPRYRTLTLNLNELNTENGYKNRDLYYNNACHGDKINSDCYSKKWSEICTEPIPDTEYAWAANGQSKQDVISRLNVWANHPALGPICYGSKYVAPTTPPLQFTAGGQTFKANTVTPTSECSNNLLDPTCASTLNSLLAQAGLFYTVTSS